MLKIIVALSLLYPLVHGDMAPSYPEPGTVWTTGKEYEIVWFDDKQQPDMRKTWTSFNIDFMTGDNRDQKFLKRVAKGLNANNTTSFKWTAPNVEPYAPIYFFKFTNDNGELNWTTRFGIAGPHGELEKPTFSKQPDGDMIPWGIGKIVEPKTNHSTSPTVTSAVEKTTPERNVEKNAAIPIAVSREDTSSAPEQLPSLLFISCFAFYLTFLLI